MCPLMMSRRLHTGPLCFEMSGCKHTCEGAEAGRASAPTKTRFSVTKGQIRALTLHIFQVTLEVREPALCSHVNFKKEPGVEV